MGPQTYIFRGFMVHNMVFRWPKPLFFMGLAARGIYTPSKLDVHPRHIPLYVTQFLPSYLVNVVPPSLYTSLFHGN